MALEALRPFGTDQLLFAGCQRVQGRVDDVLDIMQEMRSMPGGKGPNLVNYNIAIGSCARARYDMCNC